MPPPQVPAAGDIAEASFTVPAVRGNPFTAVEAAALVTQPDGTVLRLPLFHDGDTTWRLRHAPRTLGTHTFRIRANHPALDGRSGSWDVAPRAASNPGFLDVLPGGPFVFDDGSRPFLLGDTIYNAFGAAHSGLPVEPYLARRAAQGFNIFRMRLATSVFHPNSPMSAWMTRPGWCWGGGPQCPEYDRFNVDYYRTVETVLAACARLGVGVELILEAWMFEAPFGRRDEFRAEHEELWIEYTMARLGAFRSVWLWCPANEYNLYTKTPGDPLATRYQRRLARLIRHHDAARHPVGAHVTAVETLDQPVWRERFRGDDSTQVLLLQTWGDFSDVAKAALVPGLEDEMRRSALGADQAVVLAEYGYEVPQDAAVHIDFMKRLGPDHNRRGALRSLFLGVPVFTGFDPTWGPSWEPERELPGAAAFPGIVRLCTEDLGWPDVRPAPELLRPPAEPPAAGHAPLALSARGGELLAVYLPAGGEARPAVPVVSATWIHPVDGARSAAEARGDGAFAAPGGTDRVGNPADWILLARLR